MKREDLLGVKNRLDGLVASFQLGNYSIGYCKSTLRDLVTLFSQMMQQHSIDMWVVFGYDIRDYYKKIPDISQFGVWIAGVAEVILMNLHQRRESVDVDVREEIIRILEQSEESELTLDFLAASLHMRTDAASRIFRQVMGKGYTEYIRERKMKTAVELLEQDVTVKEIAERIGYSSAQYFIRVFKEEYGVTPYQYKKRQKEGKE